MQLTLMCIYSFNMKVDIKREIRKEHVFPIMSAIFLLDTKLRLGHFNTKYENVKFIKKH